MVKGSGKIKGAGGEEKLIGGGTEEERNREMKGMGKGKAVM